MIFSSLWFVGWSLALFLQRHILPLHSLSTMFSYIHFCPYFTFAFTLALPFASAQMPLFHGSSHHNDASHPIIFYLHYLLIHSTDLKPFFLFYHFSVTPWLLIVYSIWSRSLSSYYRYETLWPDIMLGT